MIAFVYNLFNALVTSCEFYRCLYNCKWFESFFRFLQNNFVYDLQMLFIFNSIICSTNQGPSKTTIRYISVNTRYINTGKEKSCMKGEQENIDTYTSYYLYAYINTNIHTNMYICMYTIYIIHNLKIWLLHDLKVSDILC